MSPRPELSYAVVTPARNEEADLPRLAACLERQSAPPRAWVVVDTGSTDETAALAARLGGTVVAAVLATGRDDDEAVVVEAFRIGVAALAERPDIVLKVDADVSFEAGHVESLLARFADDPELGIASGTCLELRRGRWRERHVTGDHVWGACRAYRAACLADVSPLPRRLGWDGIDAFTARAKGWRTATFRDLPFSHHRPEGRRNGRWAGWRARGRAAHFMGYRPGFVVLRALHHAHRDPFALASVYGWAAAAARREPRWPDAAGRALLRREQRLRELPARLREARGRRGARGPHGAPAR